MEGDRYHKEQLDHILLEQESIIKSYRVKIKGLSVSQIGLQSCPYRQLQPQKQLINSCIAHINHHNLSDIHLRYFHGVE